MRKPGRAIIRHRKTWLKWTRSGGEPLQHRIGAAEPWPFATALVAGHRGSFIQHLLYPLARFGVASLGRQQTREVEIRLRQGRDRGRAPEERFGSFFLSGQRVGVSEQCSRARKSVAGGFRNHTSEI